MDFDADRLRRNKRDILDIRRSLEDFTSGGRDAFLADPRNALSVKYLLVQVVEAIADTCQHLLSRVAGVACEGYVDCILKAGEHGLLPLDLADKLRRLADLRNSIVHRYWIIDDRELYRLCRENSGDFRAFVDRIEERLRSRGDDTEDRQDAPD